MKRMTAILATFGLLFLGTQAMQAQSSCSKKASTECAKKCDGEKRADCEKKTDCEKKCDGDKKTETATDIEFASITMAQLNTLMAAGGFILYDARGADSYSSGHIDGAVLFAGAELPEDKATPMVFYCGGPRCSAAPKAARKVIADGYTNVMVFTGGWLEWNEAGSDQAGL